MRRYGVIVLACLLGIGILTYVRADTPEQKVPDAFYLRHKMFEGHRFRPPVEFTHRNHVENYTSDCTDCHHNYQEGEPVEKCSACHFAADEDTPSLKNAFHKTCRECHIENMGPDSAAPVKCHECHGQIDYYDFEPPRTRPSVVFTHLNHWQKYRTPCRRCHHRYENGKNVWQPGDPVRKCNTCHGKKARGKVVNLKIAFHRLCKGCHQGLVDEGKAVPYRCDECHYVFKNHPYRAFPKLTSGGSSEKKAEEKQAVEKR